ncbi:NHL repeat-containing protein [Candidatus Riflebacteria bacterium]
MRLLILLLTYSFFSTGPVLCKIRNPESSLFNYYYEWGKAGSGNDQLMEPTGIAINKKKIEVAVSDTRNDRVQIFQINGQYLRTIKGDKKGKFLLKKPRSLVFTRDGRLVVANTGAHEIHIYNKNEQLVTVIGKQGWKSGYFLGPVCVTMDGNDHIFTVEPRGKFISGLGLDFFQKQRVQGNRAQEFDLKGKFIRRIGHMHRIGGKRIRQLNSPESCFVDKKGYIWFADTGNHRILKYKNKDDATPVHPISLCYPQAIYQDDDGDIYLSDTHNHRIVVLNSNGILKTFFGQKGSLKGEFSQPGELEVIKDRLFICDRMNHRIQVFQIRSKSQIKEGFARPDILK